MIENNNSKDIQKLLLKIEQLEFDKRVLEAQNNYMKSNIKLCNLQATPKNKNTINSFLKIFKSKIWRK